MHIEWGLKIFGPFLNHLVPGRLLFNWLMLNGLAGDDLVGRGHPLLPDLKMEKVRTSQLARIAKGKALFPNPLKVDPRQQDDFGSEGRSGNILPIRTDHSTPTVKQVLLPLLPGSELEFTRKIRHPHYSSGSDYETTTLHRVMTTGYLIHLSD
jgi:hypothetical protein